MDGILAPWHWIIVIAIGLLVFGPKKLPELGSSLGKGIASFRHSLKETQDEIASAVAQPDSTETVAPAATAEPVAQAASEAAAVAQPAVAAGAAEAPAGQAGDGETTLQS
jgi:sec-independent protein translocase protein TatA